MIKTVFSSRNWSFRTVQRIMFSVWVLTVIGISAKNIFDLYYVLDEQNTVNAGWIALENIIAITVGTLITDVIGSHWDTEHKKYVHKVHVSVHALEKYLTISSVFITISLCVVDIFLR